MGAWDTHDIHHWTWDEALCFGSLQPNTWSQPSLTSTTVGCGSSLPHLFNPYPYFPKCFTSHKHQEKDIYFESSTKGQDKLTQGISISDCKLILLLQQVRSSLTNP